MAVTDFVLNVSGTVSYTDNSHGSFESVFRQGGSAAGVVAQHSSTESEENFSRLLADHASDVDTLLSELPGAIVLTATSVTPVKTVADFTMSVSGTVTYDDNTKGSFAVQWINGGVVNVDQTETTSNWTAIATEASGDAVIVFDAVAGSGNTTVSNVELSSAPSALIVSWNPTSDDADLVWTDNSTIETSFRVERKSPTGGGTYATVASVAADVTTYTDATANAGSSYDYRVIAVNAGGDSEPSNVDSITT